MAERPIPREPTGFQTAIEELTDGLSQLVRQHFELARTEVRREASEFAGYLQGLVVFGTVALMGYGVLNLAIIVVAFWIGGVAAMAITAVVLALLQLGVGAIGALRIVRNIQNEEVGLPETTEELQKDKQWLKEIRDNNSSVKRLPEQTS